MQDYHIYAHYLKESSKPNTSPQKQNVTRKTTVSPIVKEERHTKRSLFSVQKLEAVAIASAYKINGYVGAITENTVTQRKVQLGLTAVGLAKYATVNPALALGVATAFVADAGIKYGIRIYKENLSAEYMKQLSGGTVNKR